MASPIAWTDVTTPTGAFPNDPNLLGASTALQTILLSIVNGSGIAVDNFGGEDAALTKSARVFYAAHMATLAARRGVSGAISSQSEGGASQSYWMGFLNPRLLHLTGYGQMLIQIIMGTPARAGVLV